MPYNIKSPPSSSFSTCSSTRRKTTWKIRWPWYRVRLTAWSNQYRPVPHRSRSCRKGQKGRRKKKKKRCEPSCVLKWGRQHPMTSPALWKLFPLDYRRFNGDTLTPLQIEPRRRPSNFPLLPFKRSKKKYLPKEEKSGNVSHSHRTSKPSKPYALRNQTFPSARGWQLCRCTSLYLKMKCATMTRISDCQQHGRRQIWKKFHLKINREKRVRERNGSRQRGRFTQEETKTNMKLGWFDGVQQSNMSQWKGGKKKEFCRLVCDTRVLQQQQSAHGNANESIITLNSPTVFTSPCFQRPDRYVSTSAHLFESKLENSPQRREKRKRDGAQSLHSSFLREMGWCVCTHIGATVDDDYDISLSAISFSPAEKRKKERTLQSLLTNSYSLTALCSIKNTPPPCLLHS